MNKQINSPGLSDSHTAPIAGDSRAPQLHPQLALEAPSFMGWSQSRTSPVHRRIDQMNKYRAIRAMHARCRDVEPCYLYFSGDSCYAKRVNRNWVARGNPPKVHHVSEN